MSAHLRCAPARRQALLLALALPLAAQDAPPIQARPTFVGALHRALASDDATLRGTAAIVLAGRHDPADYAAILPIARDRNPEARVRGIVALGILAAPGCEAFLADVLLDDVRDASETDRAAAAYALGLLPEGHATPGIDNYLGKVASGSYRRHRAILAALLLGLAQTPHPTRAAVLRALAEDPSNRDAGLRRMALTALATIPDALTRSDALRALRGDDERERLGTLELARAANGKLEPRQVERLRTTAAQDKSARVRAAAVRLLGGLRDHTALEVALRALRSRDAHEAAAGARVVFELGGGAIREAAEGAVLAAPPDVQAALLAALDHATSPALRDGCLRIANDRSAPQAVRVEAAALAARSSDRRAKAALRTLFCEVSHPELLRSVAAAVVALDSDLLTQEHVYPPTSTEDLVALPARLAALLAAGWPRVGTLFEQVLEGDLGPATTTAVWTVLARQTLRHSHHGDRSLLPPELRAVFD